MTRQHPFFSPIGCLGGSLLILGLVVAVVLSGGMIFSPGPLTALAQKGEPLQGARSHAAFETDCRQCHAPFQGIAVERCEACHTDVRAERAAGQGLHGHLAPDQAAHCGRCHDDHEGQAHDPSAAALKVFDHAVIGFSLTRHVVDYRTLPLACDACHTLPGYALETAKCMSCHAIHDVAFMQDHVDAFGSGCTTCHDGVDRTAGFDHAQTAFPLEGQHAGLGCAGCHTPATAPADTPAECAACHTAPALHAGVFGDDCATCHNPASWKPADLPGFPDFDHTQTTFQLVNHSVDYAGAPLTCPACHIAESFAVKLEACADCHSRHDPAFMVQHILDYDQNCSACHDGAGNMQGFDHARLFPLDGAHAPLACAACHVDQQFRGTQRACVACHTEPPIHAGVFGLKCEGCHATSAWAPARLTQHTFPLDHGEEGEIACATCHPASYVAYTCTNCHEHDLNEMRRQHTEVSLGDHPLEACAACHAGGRKEQGGD